MDTRIINTRKYEITDKTMDYKVDVPVLIMFFNRPDNLLSVFSQVKKARPSVLFLYQDGCRVGNTKDVELCSQCRQIVGEIDWNCTVYTLYQDQNYGCDPSGYLSRKWVFSLTDRCIILEDDCVPSVSFFSFCAYLLEKYKDDKRIYRISGQNIMGKYAPYDGDYFFTKGGSIWGWATWKRVFDEWDSQYHFLDDKEVLDTIKYSNKTSGVPAKRFIKTCIKHKNTGKEYFESIFFASRILGSGLTIVPRVNLISNIGICQGAVHATSNIKKINHNVRKAFFAETYLLPDKVKDPLYILEDKKYEDRQSYLMGWNVNVFVKLFNHIESFIRNILYR